ncbi:rod shape-determining protein RodA [Candidatus Falkowbacteria bacterium]|nr:rod shape-determining protein RodA [Candidatus Falkowbacteria bacterium]
MHGLLARLKNFDWVLMGSAFLLVSFGLAVVYGVTLSREVPDWSNLQKQGIAAVLGFVLFFLFSLLDYTLLYRLVYWFYGLSVALLSAVLIFGVTIRGTRGWFSLAGFNFQPVEFVKIAVIIMLAYYFSRRTRPFNQMRYFLVSGLLVFVLFALVILQPDFGSGLMLFFIWLGLLLIIGPRPRQLLSFAAVGVVAFVVLWNFVFAPYQQDRLRTFINPQADPLGSGYNVTQSVIAIGSGGLVGRGLSFGSQSQLKFLPEAQTDFVFAVIAEEFGLLGVLLLLGLFTVMMYRLYKIARRCRDDFPLFLILGVMVLLLSQLLMNIGMNLGMAPVTGITLPLVSYGGSSLLFMLFALGLAHSVRTRG